MRSVSCPCRSAGRTITTILPCRHCGNSSSRRARPVHKATRWRNCSARSSSRAAARQPRPRPALPLGQPERHRTRRFRFRSSARRPASLAGVAERRSIIVGLVAARQCRRIERHRRHAAEPAGRGPSPSSPYGRRRRRYRRHQPKHDPVVLHLRRLIDQRRHQRGQQQSRRATDPDAGAIVERLLDADDRYGLIPGTRSRCGAAAACAYLTGSVAGGSPGTYGRDRSRGRHRRHLDCLNLVKRGLSVALVDRGGAGRADLLRQCRHHRGQHGIPPAFPSEFGDVGAHRAQALAAGQLSPRLFTAGRALAFRLPRRVAAGSG